MARCVEEIRKERVLTLELTEGEAETLLTLLEDTPFDKQGDLSSIQQALYNHEGPVVVTRFEQKPDMRPGEYTMVKPGERIR